MKFHVFPYERDAYRSRGIVQPFNRLFPFGKAAFAAFYMKRFANRIAQAFFFELERNFVNRFYVQVLNNGFGRNVAKQREFFFCCKIDGHFASENDNVRLNSQALQIFYAVLGRLCFKFLCLFHIRHKG